jgi:hypothetical protein
LTFVFIGQTIAILQASLIARRSSAVNAYGEDCAAVRDIKQIGLQRGWYYRGQFGEQFSAAASRDHETCAEAAADRDRISLLGRKHQRRKIAAAPQNVTEPGCSLDCHAARLATMGGVCPDMKARR